MCLFGASKKSIVFIPKPYIFIWHVAHEFRIVWPSFDNLVFFFYTYNNKIEEGERKREKNPFDIPLQMPCKNYNFNTNIIEANFGLKRLYNGFCYACFVVSWDNGAAHRKLQTKAQFFLSSLYLFMNLSRTNFWLDTENMQRNAAM